MALTLDLRLTRRGDRAWGFRLIGGVDFNMPLTVVKVQPASPAEAVGLQNGDTLLSISGLCADALTHDHAYDVIKASDGELLLEIARGCYDPVLDDQEPLFDQIDQTEDELVDFVPLSDPSEVFTTIPDLSREPSMNPDALSRGTSELADRSMTASPFVLPVKPYRPFSTEPIPEVPPLEDPILLNPNYHDEFGHPDDEDFLPKSKFKLPISEQYDPVTDAKSKTLKTDGKMRLELSKKETKEEMEEDLMFMKQMKQNIDLERMEKTASTVIELTNVAVAASNVVEDSLFKAVTVAEEIKKEIDVELTSFESSEVKSSKIELSELKSTSAKSELTSSDSTTAKSELTSSDIKISDVKQSTKTKEEIVQGIVKKKSERKEMEVAQTLQSEKDEIISAKEERKVSLIKQEVEETIVAGTVKRLSNNFDKEIEKSSVTDVQKVRAKDTQIKVRDTKEDNVTTQTNTKSSLSSKQSTAQKSAKTEKKSQKGTENKTNFSTAKLLAEQRAYTIGLQTIPNIRGKVHSSYHYNLLLKTFFIHLTDVMVALSRFILAENVLSLEEGQDSVVHITNKESVIQNENTIEQELVSTEDNMEQNEIASEQQETIEEKQDIITQLKAKKDLILDETDLIEKRTLSGAKMAQLTSHTPGELTEKMDAVITEFQTKAGIEESSISEQETLSTQERHSRSKSRIEDEVSKESDPLEWLSKKEEAKEVIAEIVQACKAVEEVTQSEICVTEANKETRTVEKVTKTEQREDRRSKSKDRTTYIAIVESHCYTNKDAILEEHLSGSSSVQNSADIKESTENIFLENAQITNSVEETKQVTQEEVAMETATVNVEETKKVFLEEARKVSVTDVSKQYVSEQVQLTKVENVTEATKNVEPEPVAEKVEEHVILKFEPAEIIQEHAQATVQILKEIPASPVEEVIQISTSEKTSKSELQYESNLQSKVSASKFESQTQEMHQITQRTDVNQQTHQLSLDLKQDGHKISHSDSFPSTIDTPTPATIPPTPLTDEYVFRLEIPLPKTSGLPPEDEPEPSPEKESDHEDLNIVKKWDIDSPTIEAVIYDPPLATPLDVKDAPMFSNAVLSEASSGDTSKEEILEIGRKSSLLASAIDETIKCIEEYKEQVGMKTRRSLSSEETNKTSLKMDEVPLETQPMYNGIVAEAKTTIYADTAAKTSDDAEKHKENWSKVTEQFRNNGKAADILTKASESTVEESYAASSTVAESKDVSSSFVSQNVKETFDTSSTIAGNVATADYATKDIFSNQAAVREYQDVLISNIVSQNTDAVNKLSEYSTSTTDSLLKDTFVSNATSEIAENITSSFEAHATDTNILTSSILTEDVQESQKSIDELAKITQSLITQTTEVKTDPLQKIRSVPFNPDELKQGVVSVSEEAVAGFRSVQLNVASNNQGRQLATPRNVIVDGEVLATHQGIISGLENPVIDEETAKELGKPGLTDERIAEIMSGESEMLREAHVMGVDFKKIKPTIEKLKDSEVLKVLNDELTKTKEEVKKEERKWTTFLQKPDRPLPQAKFGYHGWLPQFIPPQELYKVKIVKQPKPKIAPDYKPEDFETGLLPWELRAATEPPPPPVSAEDPILIPEEEPEFYEAVDPLPESEVPDLEETGIALPVEKLAEPLPEPEQPEVCPEEIQQEKEEEIQEEQAEELTEEMEQNRVAEQLLNNVQSMVDPNATLEQQLAQMRAQLAALAQLPGVIQQSLELVTRQLMQITQQESTKAVSHSETVEQTEVIHTTETIEQIVDETQESTQVEQAAEEEVQQMRQPEATPEEIERMRLEEQEILEEQRRVEKQKKELMEQIQMEQESRQLKQRPTPRVGRPKPAFGPLVPAERPLVLPGGRKWRKPKDAYNEQFIAETLTAQAEILQGKTKGLSYESVLLPYDPRINFMKYEKPPVSLDHLKDSDVYKMIHGMEQAPMRRVDLLTSVVAESDYREKCRSVTPCRLAHSQESLDMAQQVAP